MTDNDKDKLTIVSSNSDAEIAAKRALQLAQQALREMTANLLRVIAGAGAPYLLFRQARAYVEAEVALIHINVSRGSTAHSSPQSIHTVNPRYSDFRDRMRFEEQFGREERQQMDEEDRILRAALRLVAARHLTMTVHERTAEDKLEQALRRRDEGRAERAERQRRKERGLPPTKSEQLFAKWEEESRQRKEKRRQLHASIHQLIRRPGGCTIPEIEAKVDLPKGRFDSPLAIIRDAVSSAPFAVRREKDKASGRVRYFADESPARG